ncbi:MAG: CapA family protein, partial [Lachnospiraceae bacterium]|nr:CapA family protein [Lachnospiraceae bacterium]
MYEGDIPQIREILRVSSRGDTKSETGVVAILQNNRVFPTRRENVHISKGISLLGWILLLILLCPLKAQAEPSGKIHILALGDNLYHMGLIESGVQTDGSRDYSFEFETIRPFLEEADIKIINQETVFGGDELGFSGYPRFNCPEAVGDAIADAGFNVVLHATNHSN